MNWKVIIFWLLAFTGLGYFFFSFASYLYDRQSEAQLFFPQWDAVWPLLSKPGGVAKVLGQWFTQYYCFPLPAALLNAFLLTGIGIGCYLLFLRMVPRGYNVLLSLFLVFGLLKAHIQFNYVADGSIGLLIMVWLLVLVFSLRGWKNQLLTGLAGALIVYFTSGQLVVLYGVLLVAYGFLYSSEKPAVLFISLFAGCCLAVVGVRCSVMLPLTDGLHGSSYHDVQLQSDSFIYHVWILFSGLLLLLLGISRLLKQLQWEKKAIKITVISAIFVCLFVFSGYCLPSRYDVQSRMMDQLAFLSRRQKWDEIIGMHLGKKMPGSINRSYLNMALAQKGVLGSRLFYFDQKGPQGLLASYNRSFYMSVLLSDIHFLIGDVGLSESYAMEALTTARRGGSPRVLQRLVQISLIRHEWELAAKYLSLLKQMPVYKDWAIRHEDYLYHPEKVAEDSELKGKLISSHLHNDLLSLFDLNTLWNMHLSESQSNRTSYEYLGCSFLLAKKPDLFKEFLLQTANLPVSQPLPLHFQEAALFVFADNRAALDSMRIEPSVRQRYHEYLSQSAQARNQPDGIANVYKSFGNTFWFYFQYIDIGK